MKLHKLIIFILIVFLKTNTLLSEDKLFNVDNIKLERKDKSSNNDLANDAIKKGFKELTRKILLKNATKKIADLKFLSIKDLVSYYQISDLPDEKENKEYVNFSVTFDKDKIHNLFYKRGISYSDISEQELYTLPILIRNNKVFIFNNNFFYENWNELGDSDLIEFILPLENIEIIQNINQNKTSLIDVNIDDIFTEYPKKNLALIFIEENKSKVNTMYLKMKIQEKNISKSLKIKNENLNNNTFYKKIISEIKNEIINLIKSENLIDVRTPSFLNVKLKLNKKTNLVQLNSIIKKIDLIENIYVQEFNKDNMKLRIKYLGKLEKTINLLKERNIYLQLVNNQWFIKIA